MPRPSELYKKGEQPGFSAVLYYPILNKIISKPSFGRPYARAVDFIDAEEKLYSIGAALGHALRNKLDIVVKLLFAPNAEDSKVTRIMSSCKEYAKKNLEEFISEFGREPDTFGDFISYRNIEKRLRNEGMRLSAKDAIKAYTNGDRRIKKLFDEKVEIEGIEGVMLQVLWQGIQFGSSFPELTEKMYQKAYEEDRDFWTRPEWHGLTISEELKTWSLEETQQAVLQMVAAYASEYYPELLDPLDLRGYIDTEGSH